MELYFYWTIIAFGVVVVIFNIFRAEKNRKKCLLQELENQWGHFGNRDYSQQEYESIKRKFYKNMSEGSYKNYIDDITFQDLELDQVFRILDTTSCSLGSERLYEILRTPQNSSENLEALDETAEFFLDHRENRKKVQEILTFIGRTTTSSITEYVETLQKYETKSPLKDIVAALLALTAVGSIFVTPVYGIIAFCVVFVLNAYTYYRKKAEYQSYLVNFAFLLRTLKAAGLLGKEGLLPKDTGERLSQLAGEFHKLEQHAGIVMSMKSSGSPMDTGFDYIRMFTHIDFIKFLQMVEQIKKKTKECQEMMKILSELDVAIAIASFRQALPFYCKPELTQETKATYCLRDGYHPLLSQAVGNSIQVGTDKGVLVTGSNASGKSTFLKMVAVNSILAQTIDTVAAKRYKAPCFTILSSMALRDNLQDGESYYMAEIKALKRILDAEKKVATPLLCFVDEVLRGTNTTERIAASTQILRTLNTEKCLCFGATHDIELTYLLEKEYDNYHFREEIKENDMTFSYELNSGRSESRNAIGLLRIMGYEEKIVNQSFRLAQYFEATGRWQ